MSTVEAADVIEFAKHLFQKFSAAGNTRDELRTLLFLLTLAPQNSAVRQEAARILIAMKEHKYRAEARDILEDGLFDHGVSQKSVKQLIKIYLTHGPVERAKLVIDELGERAKEALGEDYDSVVQSIDGSLDVPAAAGIQGAKGSRRVKYPPETDLIGPLDALFERHIANSPEISAFKFQRSDKIFTMGSCFAGRIARAFAARGLATSQLMLEETVNTTHANRELLSHLLGETAHCDYWAEELKERGQTEKAISAHIRTSAVVIYTLGVAPAFFNKATGVFTPHSINAFKTRLFAQENTYRMASVAENLENQKYIFDILLKINPALKLVLSVSPVPLQATFA